jgi:limonene-1,2-epoxide hydrolase
MTDLEPKAIVLAFFKDWETGFVPAFEKWIHPDCLWQNTGLPDQNGKANVMALLTQYNEIMQMPFGRVEIISIACDGGTVLTERVDHLWGEGDLKHSARIMGAFEVKDGLISRYSDYFDGSQFKAEEFAS